MSLLFSSLLYMLSLSSVGNFSNVPDSLRNADYERYMQKSKNQTTAASIFVGAGIAGGLLTLLFALFGAVGDGLVTIASLGTYEPKRRSYTIPLLLSGVTIAIGAILFSAASRNKKIANKLSVDIGIRNTPLLKNEDIKHYAYPALSVKFRF